MPKGSSGSTDASKKAAKDEEADLTRHAGLDQRRLDKVIAAKGGKK